MSLSNASGETSSAWKGPKKLEFSIGAETSPLGNGKYRTGLEGDDAFDPVALQADEPPDAAALGVCDEDGVAGPFERR